ncbi:unnamed protein product [Spodoptera exigua]|nr:unnamed protein product [Spodoptera exigua]
MKSVCKPCSKQNLHGIIFICICGGVASKNLLGYKGNFWFYIN